MEDGDKDENSNIKHSYYANAIGFTALCILLMVLSKGCTDESIEHQKTLQIESHEKTMQIELMQKK